MERPADFALRAWRHGVRVTAVECCGAPLQAHASHQRSPSQWSMVNAECVPCAVTAPSRPASHGRGARASNQATGIGSTRVRRPADFVITYLDSMTAQVHRSGEHRYR